MFNWFKDKKTKCKHFKKSGEKPYSNMKTIFRFSDYRKEIDGIGKGISQCTECGKRAFNCFGYHLMSNSQTKAIDDFINYKITTDEFIELLKTKFKWFEVKETQ